MITAKQLESLKKRNINIDTEKVKVRVPRIYKSVSKSQKDELKKLTGGMSYNAFYNVAKSSGATAKVVLLLAQVMSVNPYYLIGESDEVELSDNSVLKEFYQKCIGGKPKTPRGKAKAPKAEKEKHTPKVKTAAKKASSTKAKTEKSTKAVEPDKPARAAKPVPEKQKKIIPDEDYDIIINNTPQFDKLVKSLKEDEAIILLKALVLKAKTGGEAEVLWDTVKRCLLKS